MLAPSPSSLLLPSSFFFPPSHPLLYFSPTAPPPPPPPSRQFKGPMQHKANLASAENGGRLVGRRRLCLSLSRFPPFLPFLHCACRWSAPIIGKRSWDLTRTAMCLLAAWMTWRRKWRNSLVFRRHQRENQVTARNGSGKPRLFGAKSSKKTLKFWNYSGNTTIMWWRRVK